jgi:hypothetical protein
MSLKRFSIILAFSSGALLAQTTTQAPQQHCSADAYNAISSRAEANEAKGQFLLGSQQMLGQCPAFVEKNVKQGFANISKAAAQNYAPAMYVVGVTYLKKGLDQPALAMLFGAAKGGFREAEIMLGMMFANDKFSKKDNINAYGWLSLALHHATMPKQQKVLEDKLSDILTRLNPGEVTKAEEIKTKFLQEMGSIIAFSDPL